LKEAGAPRPALVNTTHPLASALPQRLWQAVFPGQAQPADADKSGWQSMFFRTRCPPVNSDIGIQCAN
jgi:hypothetical protein